MSPRVVPDPIRSAPDLVIFLLAAVVSFFAAGWAIGGYVFDRLTTTPPQEPKP